MDQKYKWVEQYKWIAAPVLAAAVVAGSFGAEPSAEPKPAGASFDLVTESEAAAWNTAQTKAVDSFSTRDASEEDASPTCYSMPNNDADNPKIRVVAPALGKATSPLELELQFAPTASAPIRPETLRICYVGAVTMDITKRITDRASISEKGLRVSGVQLPRGHHHLVMVIADRRGRLGRREADFDIL
jgi:hypothetical protein